MKSYKKILDVISKALQVVAAVMLAVMVLIIVYQVVMRYFFNNTPAWSEEISLQLMIWFCFIAMMLGVKQNIHIALEIFMSKLPPKALFVVELADKIFILIFGASMGYFIIPYIQKLMNNKLPATGMPVGYQYLVAVIAGFMIVLISIEHIISQIRGEEAND